MSVGVASGFGAGSALAILLHNWLLGLVHCCSQEGAALNPLRTRVYCPLHAGRCDPRGRADKDMQHRRRTLRQLFNAGKLDLPLTAPVAGQGPEAAAAGGTSAGRAAVAAPVQQAAAQDVATSVKRPAADPAVVGEAKRARQQ